MEGKEELVDRRQHDSLLEKIIKVTEDFLKAQNEYLHELILLKTRFDLNDRDHSDLKREISFAVANTFEMLNKMNISSNEKIINLLEKNEDCNTATSYRFERSAELIASINGKLSILTTIVEDLKNFKKESSDRIAELKEDTQEVSKTFTLIQKILGAILLASVGVQITSSVYKSTQDKADKDSIKLIIQEEIKKAINRR